tara:strand:- start:88968 stop:89069 length:102 start_codon:yes stop_codon:yes gene_type:complete
LEEFEVVFLGRDLRKRGVGEKESGRKGDGRVGD